MSFIAIVTRHLSPVLIEHEFAVIRQPGVLRALENDSLSVRVLSASAEITAKYLIDEQPMEIAIKLPQDYPLRNVEVKEVNRVGVTEGKWRGWMLNVQQLVMSRVRAIWIAFLTWMSADTGAPDATAERIASGGSQVVQIECLVAFRGQDGMFDCECRLGTNHLHALIDIFSPSPHNSVIRESLTYGPLTQVPANRTMHSRIISMNDRSLPSRACPTCKNKYHANCLFTWFKSSNSSTCPMCRSLF